MSRRRRYTYEEYIKAMKLLEKGYTLTETCRILGWPKEKRSLLYYWKHGIIPPAVKKVLGIRKYREYSHEDYKRAMNMLREGYKPSEISRILGINESTVKNWKNGKIPPVAKWKAEPCIELGYGIGTIHGDGNVNIKKERYRYRIILATIDPEFAETFSRAMARVLGVKYHKPWWDEKRKVWVVEYNSKAFYTWYKKTEEQGLKGFKNYIEYDSDSVRYYLKGLFDSEGYNYRCKQIFLCNSDINLLRYMQYLLKKYFNIRATGPYLQKKAGTTKVINEVEYNRNYNYYYISINKREHVQKFLREIGFSIVRKQLGLRRHEKVFVEGIGYVKPYKLVELGLFKLPFSDNQ